MKLAIVKILIVMLSLVLMFSISEYPLERYYYSCCMIYALTTCLSAHFCIKFNSTLLLFYAMVNLLAAFVHYVINLKGAYAVLKGVMWHNHLSLSLFIDALDLLLIVSGVFSGIIHLINMLNTNNTKRKYGNQSLVSPK